MSGTFESVFDGLATELDEDKDGIVGGKVGVVVGKWFVDWGRGNGWVSGGMTWDSH